MAQMPRAYLKDRWEWTANPDWPRWARLKHKRLVRKTKRSWKSWQEHSKELADSLQCQRRLRMRIPSYKL